MKKTQEDAAITREAILDAARACFYSAGFKNTSLDQIAKEANVTRGAVYWHFKDKKALFREAVKDTFEANGGVVNYAHSLPIEYDYADRLYEVFWFAHGGNEGNNGDTQGVDFIYKAMIIAQNHDDDFQEVKELIQLEKLSLYRYFVEETRMQMRLKKIDNLDPEHYAGLLFIAFEGLFLMKGVKTGVADDKESIKNYIDLIIKDIV